MSSTNSPSDPEPGQWRPPSGPVQWGPPPPAGFRPPPPPDPPPYWSLVPTWARILLVVFVLCLALSAYIGLSS